MNVAIFTDNDFGNVNGVTTSLKAVLRHAPEAMHPRIYTASDLGVDSPDYLALASFGVGMPFYKGMRMYMPRLWTFLRMARRDRIELIHLTTPGPIGLAALFVAWRTGLKMVGTFHTDLAAYTATLSGSARLGALMREYMRWPYGRCSQILVPSSSTRDALIAAKMDPRKIRLWTRGVDTERFSPDKRSVALRRHWGVDDQRPAILYVGRVSREKNLSLLPAIQRGLYRRGIAHRFVMVGDGPLRPELQSQCPDMVFLGVLSPDDVACAMASADVFVFPSDTDSAGNVVLEAQACGLPVVVSDQGGPQEYMVPGVTGMRSSARDPDRFAHDIAQLLRNNQRRSTIRLAARDHALTLRWDRALAPLYRAYAEVYAESTVPAIPAATAEGNVPA